MATGIGIGIAGQVFQTKAGVGIGPDADCEDSCSVNFANVNGGTQTQWLTGAQGTAMTIGAGGIGDFSISFWIYPTNISSGTNMRIFYFGATTAIPSTGLIQMHINATGTQLIGTAKVDDQIQDQSSAFGLIQDKWTHITWTVARTAAPPIVGKWYVDGVFVGNTDTDGFDPATNVLTTPTTGPFYIGRSTGAAQMFEGNLDDFTIWNRALTPAEIIEIMTVSIDPTVCMNTLSFYDDLTHWWEMGDPQGDVSYPIIPDAIGTIDMEMKGMSASNIDCSLSPSGAWTYIPDLNFQAELTFTYGVAFPIPNYCLTSAVSGLSTVDVSSQNISDLTGIEDFTALNQLFCDSNQLTSLDVTQNTALATLDCEWNQLTSLDLSQNTALYRLRFNNNQLTSLDLSSNIILYELYGNNNQLTSFDVSNNTALGFLECTSNQLTSLDVRNGNNTAISTANFKSTSNPNLYCISVDDVVWSEANWTNIDAWTSFSLGCGLYTYIPDANFQNELIASYGVVFAGATYPDHCLTTYVSALPNVDVSNKLISDLTGIEDFADLIILECNLNTIGSLDVSSNKYLNFLGCYSNKLTSLITTGLTNLDQVHCYDNDIASLDVSTNTALTELSARENLLTTLNISGTNALTRLYCQDNLLTSLDVSALTDLTHFWCFTNDISSLDVRNNSNLIEFSCGRNKLSGTINTSYNTSLRYLDCSSMINSITSLDVSNNTALTSITCQHNDITGLTGAGSSNLSALTALIELHLQDNQLTELNVKNGNNSAISTLDFSAQINSFSCISVSDVGYTSTNWTNVDAGMTFTTDFPCP